LHLAHARRDRCGVFRPPGVAIPELQESQLLDQCRLRDFPLSDHALRLLAQRRHRSLLLLLAGHPPFKRKLHRPLLTDGG
jgi:hypothetical protein